MSKTAIEIKAEHTFEFILAKREAIEAMLEPTSRYRFFANAASESA